MKLLDLFCGAGGSTVGYSHHFDVTGLDHRYQLRFPFPNSFILCDALEFLQNNDVSKYDVIAASPPCQAYSSATNHAGWPDLIPDLRRALIATGKPYIIENVVGAPLIKKQTVLLCGSMFGLPLHRHRLFESNIPLHTTFCIHEWQKPIYTKHNNKPTSVMHVYGAGGGKGAEDWNKAMEIDWMLKTELVNAVPPAYTKFLGAQLYSYLKHQELLSGNQSDQPLECGAVGGAKVTRASTLEGISVPAAPLPIRKSPWLRSF
jgi:DNA (cytosine-5)-methyltransferase 1